MRAFAVLSTVAITAALAVAVPGSVTENTAMASTTDCAVAHTPVMPVETTEGSNIYNIQSAANLVYLSVNQDLGDPKWRTRNFVQTASIDLQGCTWTPIGRFLEENEMPFTGTFNGDGHPIKNLRTESLSYSGLFGFTDGAEIAGVRLVDANVTVRWISSTLVGLAERTNISDSSATGSVSGTGNGIGGLVGQAASGSTIDRSFSAVSVTRTSGSGLAYGGLVGSLSESSIANSHATGAVSAGGRAGGLVGEAGFTSTISNSYSRGAVTGASGVGGLIGFLPTPTTLTVTNSYATGAVTGNSGDGGLIGDKAASNVTLTVTNSFWDTTTTHLTTTLDNQGAGRDTEDMTSIATFTDTESPDLNQAWPIVEGWQSFDPNDGRVWGIRSDLNDGYPYLLWEYETDPPFACGALVDGVYQVSTAEHLAKVGSGGSTEGAACGLGDSYKQTADIELTGVWTPIGQPDSGQEFAGEFDGAGFSIRGLTIDVQGTVPEDGDTVFDGQGLFGNVALGALITRVTLVDVAITHTRAEQIGALVGRNAGTISHSSTSGTVTGGGNIGGLVGRNEGTVIHSTADVRVHGGDSLESPQTRRSGGLVGRSSKNSVIQHSAATGDVDGYRWVGGLVGENRGLVEDSTASGKVTGATSDRSTTVSVGGLVALNDEGTIRRSRATGDVVTLSAGNVSSNNFRFGGLVGYNENRESLVEDSTATGRVDVRSMSTEHFAGGLVGENQGSIIRSSAEGDITAGHSSRAGGLAGFSRRIIESSFSTGSVTANADSFAGGLVGLSERFSARVSDSFARGDVTVNQGGSSDPSVAAGLIAQHQGTIRNSYATGTVTISDPAPGHTPQVAGLVASVTDDSSEALASFFDVTTTGLTTSTQGTGLPTASLTTLATFTTAGWSISCRAETPPTVWGIDPTINDGYPFLTWSETGSFDSCPPPPTQTSPGSTSGTSKPTTVIDSDLLASQESGARVAPSETSPGQVDDRAPNDAPSPDGSSIDGNPLSEPLGGQTGDTDSLVSEDAIGSGTSSIGTSGWLWAIGLGGLGAAALIAGGVAFSRMRP